MYRRVSPVTFDRGRKNVRSNAFRPYHARRNREATVLATDFPSSSASGSVPLRRSVGRVRRGEDKALNEWSATRK
jgi:hypothetical protein